MHESERIPMARPVNSRTDDSWTDDWRDETAADRSDAAHVVAVACRLLLLAGLTCGDLVAIKSTLDHVLRLSGLFSWVLAVAVTALSVYAARTGGQEFRVLTATRWRHPSTAVTVGVVVMVWAGLGAGLLWMRWHAAQLVPAVAQWEGQTATSDTSSAREHVLAVVLATVYALTGVMAWIDGKAMTNTATTAMRQARRRAAQLERQLSVKEGQVARHAEHLAAAEHDLARLPHDHQDAVAAHLALAGELKDWARLRMAVHLGDPASTGMVRYRPDQPQLPRTPGHSTHRPQDDAEEQR
jgi:hypothetical protein